MKLPFGRKASDVRDNTELVKKYLVSVINVPATPPESPERDTGLGLDNVRQLAEVDAKSGAWDHYAILALNAQFPAEDYIDSEIERRRQEHQNTLRSGLVNAAHLSEDAEHLPVSIDGRNTSMAQARAKLADSRALLAHLHAEREKDVAVVEGRVRDGTDTPWSGVVPTPPVLDVDDKWASIRLALRPDRAKQWFIDIGLTLIALGVETIIIKESIDLLRRDEGFFGYLYAIPPLIVATVLPHVIGTRLAYAVRRKSFNWQERMTLAIAVPVWLATVFFLADIRRNATEYNRRRDIADASGGQYTAESVPPEALDAQFNSTRTLLFWAVVIAAVGVALIVFKLVFYNPYVTRLVKLDSKIALVQRDAARAERDFERISGQIDVQNKSMKSTLNSWDHYIDIILPAHALELKAHYRNCLVNAFGNPEMTGVILAVPEGPAFTFAEPPHATATDTKTVIEKELL